MASVDLPTVFAMAAQSQGGTGPVWVQFLPFALILAIFYFIILLPMKRRQKKVQEFRAALKVGDKNHHDQRHLRQHHEDERAIGAAAGRRQGPDRGLTRGRWRASGAGPGGAGFRVDVVSA